MWKRENCPVITLIIECVQLEIKKEMCTSFVNQVHIFLHLCSSFSC